MDIDSALSLIRAIPDYPKPGILFQDITPMLSNGQALNAVITHLASLDNEYEIAIGIEARGFILASALAVKKEIGFVPIRKKGKLPADTFSRSYGLEYGIDEIELHRDAFAPGTKVTLIDDVLATGGTMCAAVELISACGGIVSGIATVLEIPFLEGRNRISSLYPSIPIHSLMLS